MRGARLLPAALLLVAGCGDRKAAPSAGSAPATAPLQAAATEGARPVPSLPREAWPCRAEGELGGDRIVWTYDYSSAPDRCQHLPDQWQPGCPAVVATRNESLGIASQLGYDYADDGRVVRIRIGRLGSPDAVWRDGKVISEGGKLFYQHGDREVLVRDEDGEPHSRVALDQAGLPTLVEIMYDDDGEPMAEERYTHEGGRPATYQSFAFGKPDASVRFVYDCD